MREQIVAEIMKLVGPRMVPMERKPTIDEIEKMLNSDNPKRIQIAPDGSAMVEAGAHTVGDIADAVLRVVGEREKTAEWVGYYFGLQRALNKGPHTRIAEELETEMGDVLLKMPPGTMEAWPSIVLTDETDS